MEAPTVGHKADVSKRLAAALIDAAIAWAAGIIPVVGELLGLAYLLTRDAVVYRISKNPDFKNRSVGKRLMGLSVDPPEGQGNVSWVASAKRNLPLAAGGVIATILSIAMNAGGPPLQYRTGYTGLTLVALALLICLLWLLPMFTELCLVVIDPSGRRLGDRYAGTMVIETPEAVRDSR